MLLVYYDQPHIVKRGKQRGTGPYDHIDIPVFRPLALIVFLPRGKP